MSGFITYILIAALAGYGVLLLIDLALTGARQRVLIQAGLLVAVVVLFHVTLDFPVPRPTLDGPRQGITLAIMLAATFLGSAAHYVFYKQPRRFAWQDFVRPFLATPIVLLPLFGSTLGGSEPSGIQQISFAFLAFQNGFFWKQVLKNAPPSS